MVRFTKTIFAFIYAAIILTLAGFMLTSCADGSLIDDFGLGQVFNEGEEETPKESATPNYAPSYDLPTAEIPPKEPIEPTEPTTGETKIPDYAPIVEPLPEFDLEQWLKENSAVPDNAPSVDLEEFPQDELDKLIEEMNKARFPQLTTLEIRDIADSMISNDYSIFPYNTVRYFTLYNEFALSQGITKVSGAGVALNEDDDLDKLLKRHYDYIVQFSWGLNINPNKTLQEQINSALGRTWNAKIETIYDSEIFNNQERCENAGLNPYYTNLVGASSVTTTDYVPVSYIGFNDDRQFTIVWYFVGTRSLYRITCKLPDDSEVANDRDKFTNVRDTIICHRDESYMSHGADIIRMP